MKKLFFAIFLFVVSASYANAYIVVDSSNLVIDVMFEMGAQPYTSNEATFPSSSIAQTAYSPRLRLNYNGETLYSRPVVMDFELSVGTITLDGYGGQIMTSQGAYPFFSFTGASAPSIYGIKYFGSKAVTFQNGKIGFGDTFFCMYLANTRYPIFSGPQMGLYKKQVNENCPDTQKGGELVLMNYEEKNPPPGPAPFQPLQQNIAGLVCDTYFLPNMADVSWYTNFGALPNRDVFREEKSLIQTGTGANGATDLDVVAIIGASTGATLPIGSISYPGTTYADIADLGYNGQPVAIYSWIKRGGSIAGWNVIQMNGVNTSGFFGKYGTFEGKSTDGITNQMTMYGTGTIAEANLFNKKIGTTWQVFAPVSGFSGIRVGYAPYTQRKSCYLPSINSCEWKIEGGANVCGPVIEKNFQTGICSVAGSGSLYGSGSCVPSVDSSGKVVDAGILPGEGVFITLPDGTQKLVRVQPQSISILFACPKSMDAPWYKYIFSCASEVIGNIFDKVTGSTSVLVNSSVATYSNERMYTGSFSGLVQNFGKGGNPLVGTGARTNSGALLMALKNKLDTVGQPGPEIWQKMFTAGVAVGLLIMMLTILGMIVSAMNENKNNLPKK